MKHLIIACRVDSLKPHCTAILFKLDLKLLPGVFDNIHKRFKLPIVYFWEKIKLKIMKGSRKCGSTTTMSPDTFQHTAQPRLMHCSYVSLQTSQEATAAGRSLVTIQNIHHNQFFPTPKTLDVCTKYHKSSLILKE